MTVPTGDGLQAHRKGTVANLSVSYVFEPSKAALHGSQL